MSAEREGILLESGTNEQMILEFKIAGNSFGINVAKISSLMQLQQIQPMPNSHPCVEGIFQTRGEVYTLIDLAAYLGLEKSKKPEKDIYVITSFNKMDVGFHVHEVEGIHRLSWEDIEKPDSIIYGGGDGIVTGIAKAAGRIISILDFEKITYDISPDTGIKLEEVSAFAGRGEDSAPILVAEDSMLLRKLILEALRTAGFKNITLTTNGAEAWKFLTDCKEHGGDIREDVRLVITDIEMPQMDGHRLTKLIKSDPALKGIPVVIFSSLINDDMRRKGEEVGADAQLSKPEIGNLVGIVTGLTEK